VHPRVLRSAIGSDNKTRSHKTRCASNPGYFSDDIAFKADMYDVNFAGLPMMAFMLRHLGAGEAPLQRASGRRICDRRPQDVGSMMDAHCVVTAELAERLGLGPQVRDALQQAYERWDGRGHPEGLKGDEVAVSVRLMRLARVAEVFYRRGGAEAAVAVAREWRGTFRGSSISSVSRRRNCSKRSPRRQVGRPSSAPSRRCGGCSPTRSSTRCLRRSPIRRSQVSVHDRPFAGRCRSGHGGGA
jgi:hypothetical protein